MFRVFINEEEVICNKDLTISEEILSPSSVILNNVYPKAWEDDKDYVSRHYYPQDYSICRILNGEDVVFLGIVKNTGEISLNPRYPHYCNVQAISFDTFLSQSETLDFVIENKTIEEAIDMVIDSVKDYKFIKGNISILDKDQIIGAYSCLDKTAYDLFQYLSDITGTRWFCRVTDDGYLAIDFYEPSLMALGANVQYTQEYFEKNNIIDMSFNYGTYDYRNKQIIKSSQVISNLSRIEYISITVDGQDSIMTEQPIGKVTAMSGTFASQSEKENGIVAEFYYTVGENTIEHNSDYPELKKGNLISIQYLPIGYGREIVYNNDEVNRLEKQLNRKGVVSRYEERNDSTSAEELNKIAQSYIRYKGTPEIILKIQTQDKDLFKVGNSTFFETGNKVPMELEKEYLVKKKTTKMVVINSIQNIFYTYELTSNFNAESEINYFDNQRAKSKGNIGVGEFINRNVDIENTANIVFSNLSVTSVVAVGDNILNAPLNAPFVK